MPDQDLSAILRALPSVDALLRTDTALSLREAVGVQHLASMARTVTDDLRLELQKQATDRASVNGEHAREALMARAERELEHACNHELSSGLRRVINASGVIIHTNLGRAPLSVAARRAISEEAAGYCTLEYDLEPGQRGRRGARTENLLAELTGAEDALVVNNGAAAALLVLSVLAQGGETIVSRGELVEIGGDFRVPDVMSQSGTRLVEVGTTNRTRLSDYRKAITDQTRLLMRVHPSNFRIVGFTAAPTLDELVGLSHSSGLPFYEDAGSGALMDLASFGLEGEHVIGDSIKAGVDLISFSGDKLLGAAQSGVVVGRKDLVDELRRAPLYRALRADKLALAALEATLEAYRRGTAFEDVPVLKMLAMSPETIAERASNFVERMRSEPGDTHLEAELVDGHSAIGGGAAPTTHPKTRLIALRHRTLSADALDRALRQSTPPVIARIAEERVLIDLRTVFEDEEEELLRVLAAISS
jgi:L-seryl-tRNA(Ser) seleniumtransferase